MSATSRAVAAVRDRFRRSGVLPIAVGVRPRALPTTAVSLLLFAAVFAVRMQSDDPANLVSIMFVVPIALLALELGLLAGVAGVMLALVGVAAWDLLRAPDLSFLGYLSRAVVFSAAAVIVALVSARTREAGRIQRQLLESAPDAVIGVDQGGTIVIVNAQAERLFGYTRAELIGQPIERLVPDDVREAHPPYVRAYFANPRPRPISASKELGLRGRHRLGHEFPAEISLSALEAGDGMIALAAIRDVTERKRGEEELTRAFRRLQAATDIARAVGGETELESALESIVERGRALVEARGLVVMLIDDDGLAVAATAGNVDEGIRGMRVALSGALATAISDLRPVRLAELPEGAVVAPQTEQRRAAAAIIVPLEFRGDALGVVVAFDRRGGPAFTVEDERLLLAFAASAATAVATARGAAEQRLRRTIHAAEQERSRWARELHDETLQSLGALRVTLASAAKSRSAEKLRDVVDSVVEGLADEIRALRSLITELRPAALDELGLAAALETLSERSASLVGLEMHTEVELGNGSTPGGRELDAELESTVYRLVQEALTNIAKHARAEHVHLKVRQGEDAIEVLIEDDGVGFEPEARVRGYGLVGMGERVTMAGGTLDVDSSPGRGTTVRASFPLS